MREAEGVARVFVVGVKIFPEQGDGASVGREQAAERGEEGAFAGPGGSGEESEFAGKDFHGEIAQDLNAGGAGAWLATGRAKSSDSENVARRALDLTMITPATVADEWPT